MNNYFEKMNTKYKFKSVISILIIIISITYSFTGKNNILQSSQLLKISSDKFKAFTNENGVISVLTVRSLTPLLEGTRSKKVVYNVHVENTIMGNSDEFDSIWNYGLPKLEKGKKYLIFLNNKKQFSGEGDFQQLFCEKCDAIVIACKKELNQYQK